MRILIPLLIAGLALAACDREPAESKTSPKPGPETAAQAQPDEGKPEPDEPTGDGWSSVAEGELSEAQKAQLGDARAAQQDLGKTLIGALTKSIGERGFAESVEFCRGAAPDVTNTIAEKHGVRIGRTSHRLRNPENTAPSWASTAVREETDEQVFFTGPSGELGVLSPISTADLCVNCHGPEGKLAKGVSDALAKDYPEDQATGFESGDLRGWFWVEVPAS